MQIFAKICIGAKRAFQKKIERLPVWKCVKLKEMAASCTLATTHE